MSKINLGHKFIQSMPLLYKTGNQGHRLLVQFLFLEACTQCFVELMPEVGVCPIYYIKVRKNMKNESFISKF